MDVFGKVFSPNSGKKKNALSRADTENSDKFSPSSAVPKASATKRSKAKPIDDEESPLGRSVSMTLNCDPVPSSFKTNSSFASQPKLGAACSPKSLRGLGSSFAGSMGHLDRRHQHDVVIASSASRHNRSTLFEKATFQSNSSFAPGDTTTALAASNGASGGAVNLWRLPWQQQKVVMCPNCHRPRKVDRGPNGAYVSRADYVGPQGMDTHGVADDISEASGDVSYGGGGDSVDSDNELGESVTYCRCGAPMQSVAMESGSAPATEECPPVFVVETERSSNVVLPGTIAHDSDSDGEEVDGQQRSFRLSLVSPLTSNTLRRQQPTNAQPSLGSSLRQTSAASAPKVSSWLHDQQGAMEMPASKPKTVR